MKPNKIEEKHCQSLLCMEKDFIRDFIAEEIKKNYK